MAAQCSVEHVWQELSKGEDDGRPYLMLVCQKCGKLQKSFLPRKNDREPLRKS